MKLSDLLSSSTQDAISTDLLAALQVNAQQYAQPKIDAAVKQSEDLFLYGANGEYLDLQKQAESATEVIGKWHYNGNVGNDPGKIGAGNPTALHAWTPGDTGILTAKGSLLGQANVYFYAPLTMRPVLPRRIVDHRVHQITDLRPWRALEWQCQIIHGNALHNCAVQFEFLTKTVKYYIYGDTWHAFPQQPAWPDFTKPVETYSEFALDAASTTHVAIWINGIRYALNVANPTFAKNAADKLTIAVQIDPLRDGLCGLSIAGCDLRMV